MTSFSNKSKPFLSSNFDKSKFSITTLDIKKQRENSPQFVSWQNYNGGRMVFQINKTILTQHGMPQLSQYYETDAKRSFIKYPFDPEQKNSMEIQGIIKQLDDYCVKNQKKILGDKLYKKYTYLPSLKTPVEPDELDLVDEETAPKEKKVRFSYVKLRLGLDLEKNITTKVYSNTKTVDTETNKEKSNIKKEAVKTASDLYQIMPYRSTIRLIVQGYKVWFAKNKNQEGTRMWGLSFKILQLEIEPYLSASLKNDFE